MKLRPLAQRVLWWSLVAVVAGLVVVKTNLSWATFAGSRTPTPPPVTAVALTGAEVPMLPSPHIPFLGAPHAPYNSIPPTSGPHVPWVVMTGIYTQPIPDELGVHALEHGHIGIQYAPAIPAAQVAVLREIALRFPRDVVLAPYPKLRSGIALTAWGRIDMLRSADRTAVVAFIVDVRGRYNHGWSRTWAAAHGARILATAANTSCGTPDPTTARSTRYARLVIEPGVGKTSSPSGSRAVARVISPRGVD